MDLIAFNATPSDKRAKLDELGAKTAQYIADHKDNRSNSFSFAMGMHAGSLEPKEAVSFMKETRLQYLKTVGEDEEYWFLLACFADILINFGMKHQASKLFRKIKQQPSHFKCESTVRSFFNPPSM